MTTGRAIKSRAAMPKKATKGVGIGVAEAVAGAEARIAPMKTKVNSRIAELVARLQVIKAAPDSAEATGELNASVDELTGLCGFVGMTELASAASSLCRLLDGDARAAKAAAVGVHVDAIVLFANAPPALRASMAPDVLAGLGRLVAPAPSTEAAAAAKATPAPA